MPPRVERIPLDKELFETGRGQARLYIIGEHGQSCPHGVLSAHALPGDTFAPHVRGDAASGGGVSVVKSEGQAGGGNGEQPVGIEGGEPHTGPAVGPPYVRAHVELAEGGDPKC
jgi:hypothetical protein